MNQLFSHLHDIIISIGRPPITTVQWKDKLHWLANRFGHTNLFFLFCSDSSAISSLLSVCFVGLGNWPCMQPAGVVIEWTSRWSLYPYTVKSHEMDSLWVPVRKSGGHIIQKIFLFDGLFSVIW